MTNVEMVLSHLYTCMVSYLVGHDALCLALPFIYVLSLCVQVAKALEWTIKAKLTTYSH